MTLPPPPALDDEVTVTDAEDEVAFMLDCIAIETRIRNALRFQKQPGPQTAQGLGADDESGATSSGAPSSDFAPTESGEFVVGGGTMRPWTRYFPPSSC